MSTENENWQNARATIRERCSFLYNNVIMSDVNFIVRVGNADGERKQVIHAHKFLLSISSPVFYTMFYGELAETRDNVELPDCECEGLLEFLRFIYSNEVNLSGSNVMQVMYLAKKYMVSSLSDECLRYLHDNLDPSNVFNILPFAEKFEENSLVDKCWKLIDKSRKLALESEGFLTIERPLLEAVVQKVKRDCYFKVEHLFAAVNQWAIKACERQGVEADGQGKRKLLGERILNELLFPDILMKEVEFVAFVLDTDILTPEEIFKIATERSNKLLLAPFDFLHDFYRCHRFSSMTENSKDYSTGQHDRIIFMVDKNIELHGVCLYGRRNYQRYHVIVTLKHVDSGSQLGSVTGKFSSKPLKGPQNKPAYNGIQVLFKQPVAIQKNTRYCVEALISGPKSQEGTDGFPFVKCSDVTFIFFNGDPRNSNGTTVCRGQFPEFLFTPAKRE